MSRLAILVGSWFAFMIVPFAIARLQTPPTWRARLGSIALVGMVASTAVLLGVVLMPEALVFSSVRQIMMMCSAAFRSIASHPLGRTPSILAGVVLGILLGRFWWTLVQGFRATRAARIRDLRPTRRLESGHRVYIVPLGQPEAYSLGSVRGQVVISQGLLDALDQEEQAAVLLHEEGHLRSWHQPLLLLARAAAAALRPLPSARKAMDLVEQAIEEAADDYASAKLGRPTLVASSISKAAIAGLRNPVEPVAVGAGLDVPARVRRLLDPPHVAGWVPAACGGAALTLVALIGVTQMVAGIAVLAAAHHFLGLGVASFCPLRKA